MTTITGTIHHIGQTESIGSNGFQKRLLVIDTGGKFDNLVPVDAKKDGCALLDSFQVGQQVAVEVYIGGRQWQERYFASIGMKSISAAGGSKPYPTSPEEYRYTAPPPPSVTAEGDGDIPF